MAIRVTTESNQRIIHNTATSYSTGQGELVVLNGTAQVAVYAPGHWAYAIREVAE